MKFFGGFGFSDDSRIFAPILRDFGLSADNPYDICGFSFGAQKAVRFALTSLGICVNRKDSRESSDLGANQDSCKSCKSSNSNANPPQRINRMILLSPAFFNDKNEDFKNTQMATFEKNRAIYMKAFYKNIGANAEDGAYLREIDLLDSRDLEQCLHYKFKSADLEALNARGVEIISIFGECDKIINAQIAHAFFARFGVAFFIKGANHLLR